MFECRYALEHFRMAKEKYNKSSKLGLNLYITCTDIVNNVGVYLILLQSLILNKYKNIQTYNFIQLALCFRVTFNFYWVGFFLTN